MAIKFGFTSLALCLLLASPSLAADFTWTSGAPDDDLWSSDGNWSIAGSPDADDDRAIFNVNGSKAYIDDDLTISGIQVNNNVTTTLVAEGGERTVTVTNGWTRTGGGSFLLFNGIAGAGSDPVGNKLILSNEGEALTLVVRKDPTGGGSARIYVPVEVQAGNTLNIVMTDDFFLFSQTAAVTGAGRLVIDQDQSQTVTNPTVVTWNVISVAEVVLTKDVLMQLQDVNRLTNTVNLTLDDATLRLRNGGQNQTIASLSGAGKIDYWGSGNNPTTMRTLFVNGGVTPDGVIEIIGTGVGTLNINGTSVFTDGDLLLFVGGQHLTFAGILDVTAMSIGNHLIADLNGGSLDYSSLTLQGNGSLFEQDGDLWVNVIPEPASAMLLLSGAMMLALRPRSRSAE